jgi:AraC-like DNA-binding protein
MERINSPVGGDSSGVALKTIKGESLPYRQILDAFKATIPFTEAIIVSSLPRGGLQIVQPPRLPETLVRAYAHDFESQDRLTWQAIAKAHAVRGRDAWPSGQFDASRFHREFMQPSGFAHAAAAPLTAPVINGYPGALHLYRNAEQGAFSEDDLRRLNEFAKELDAAILRIRAARDGNDSAHSSRQRPVVNQFIFDVNLRPQLPQANPSTLDERLRTNILEDARKRFEHVNGDDILADRVPLSDSQGDLWNFRVVIHSRYPALSDGPVAFFCLQPSCSDWSTLRPIDFQADGELARLVPAMKFMREHFRRGPTLVEIAKTVHLSPFHFHRRFTELLGITPKHFLLDCQIQQAKHDLLERQKDLAKIATECGFAHQSHFTSRFKQATGLTPTRWRRMAADAKRTITA